jgi:hypothetical protein
VPPIAGINTVCRRRDLSKVCRSLFWSASEFTELSCSRRSARRTPNSDRAAKRSNSNVCPKQRYDQSVAFSPVVELAARTPGQGMRHPHFGSELPKTFSKAMCSAISSVKTSSLGLDPPFQKIDPRQIDRLRRRWHQQQSKQSLKAGGTKWQIGEKAVTTKATKSWSPERFLSCGSGPGSRGTGSPNRV